MAPRTGHLSGGGLRTWWRALRGNDKDLNDGQLREMAGTFSRRLQAYCKEHDIPVIEASSEERKHELAEQVLPSDEQFEGLFLVITGNAPAPVWEVKHNAEGQIVDIRQSGPFRGHRAKWPYVKHYHPSKGGFYFHIIDRTWGHITIRMCGYPPWPLEGPLFGAQVILNGHEWVERQAKRGKLEVIKDGNCFVGGQDFGQVNELAQKLNQAANVAALRQVCERWLYSSCLCFGLTRQEQEQSGFAYTYSIFQLELSRNLQFQRGTVLDEIYQKIKVAVRGAIDRTRNSLGLEQVKTIFGMKNRPHLRATRGQSNPTLAKSVQRPTYDLTVFKLKWNHITLKIYDKGARVLRVEVVVHNAKDLKCGKLLERWPVLLDRMQGMLVRFMNVVQVAHGPAPKTGWAMAGIDLDKARNRFVIDAVVGLSTVPDGFSLSQLAEGVRERSGWSEQDYSERQAAYDLEPIPKPGQAPF